MNLIIIFIDVIIILIITFILREKLVLWANIYEYNTWVTNNFKTKTWEKFFLKTLVLKPSKISQDHSVFVHDYATYYRELGADTL